MNARSWTDVEGMPLPGSKARKESRCRYQGCKKVIPVNSYGYWVTDGEGHWIRFCCRRCRLLWRKEQQLRREAEAARTSYLQLHLPL